MPSILRNIFLLSISFLSFSLLAQRDIPAQPEKEKPVYDYADLLDNTEEDQTSSFDGCMSQSIYFSNYTDNDLKMIIKDDVVDHAQYQPGKHQQYPPNPGHTKTRYNKEFHPD